MAIGMAGGAQPDAVVTVMTEAELASMFVDSGHTVVLRGGRYWRATFPGFYEPVHLVGPMRAAQVRRPSLLCWGYRAALSEQDAHSASGSMPVHLLTDFEHYTEDLLSHGRKEDLRKSKGQVEFVRLRDPALLMEQGYGVFTSAKRRLGYRRPIAETAYLRAAQRRAADRRMLMIAGLVDGRLGGYMESYAVDGVLYIDRSYVATEVVHTGISTGLHMETFGTCTQAGTIHTVVSGLHRLENAGLCSFKKSLGFRVVQVPARVVIPAPIRVAIKSVRPATHYRLMGVSPHVTAGTQESGSNITPVL